MTGLDRKTVSPGCNRDWRENCACFVATAGVLPAVTEAAFSFSALMVEGASCLMVGWGFEGFSTEEEEEEVGFLWSFQTLNTANKSAFLVVEKVIP